MKQRFFITSTGTGIGKSFITADLVRQARSAGQSVAAYKPIISGFEDPTESDTGLLLASLGMPITDDNIGKISPWRFKAPLAPSMAARLEKREMDFDAVLRHSRSALDGEEDIVLIEGVGGIMAPLDDHHTVLDWIEALAIPIKLVTGTYLGTLSHTLTAIAVLEARQIPIERIIVNQSENATVDIEDTVFELRRFTPHPMLTVTRLR